MYDTVGEQQLADGHEEKHGAAARRQEVALRRDVCL